MSFLKNKIHIKYIGILVSFFLVINFSFFNDGVLKINSVDNNSASYKVQFFDKNDALMPGILHYHHISETDKKLDKFPLKVWLLAKINDADVIKKLEIDGRDVDVQKHTNAPRDNQRFLLYQGNFKTNFSIKLRSSYKLKDRKLHIEFGNGLSEEIDLFSYSSFNFIKSYNYSKLPGSNSNFYVPRAQINKIKIIPLSTGKESTQLNIKLETNKKTAQFKQLNENYYQSPRESIRLRSDQMVYITKTIVFIILSFFFMSLIKHLISFTYSYQNIISIIKTNKITIILFSIQLTILLIWWAGNFPGSFSNDSFASWKNTKVLNYNNFHPFLYTIYLMFFQFIIDSPWPITLVQCIATAFCNAIIFSYLAKNNLLMIISFPFFILLSFSVPLGSLSSTVWKDIPFAIALIGLTIWLFKKLEGFFYRKRELHLSKNEIIGLSLIIIFLSFLRHNAIVYIAIIPFIFIVFSRLHKSSLILSGCILFSYVFIKVAITPLLKVQESTNQPYLNIAWKVNPIAAMIATPYDKYYSKNYTRDKNYIEKAIKYETIKEHYNPSTHGYLCWDRKKFNRKINLNESNNISKAYWRMSAENLNIYMSDRAYQFFTSMGSASGRWISYAADLSRMKNLHASYYNLDLMDFTTKPIHEKLHYYLNKKISNSTKYKGLTSGRFIFWNALPSVILVCIACILYGLFPLTAILSSLYLVQIPILFLFSPSSEFRYFYFIYWFSFFIIPMMSYEYFLRKEKTSE